MEFSTGHAVQLVGALIVGLIIFVYTYFGSLRKVLAFLVLTIPFQFVTSRYGTINMVAVYMVSLSLMFRSMVKYKPFLVSVILIFVAYVFSLFNAPRAIWFDHFIYLITIGSDFLLFYIAYNLVINNPDAKFFLRLLIGMDVLCVAYSIILYFVGFDKVAFLGIEEWTLTQNLEEKQRLMGAFQAAGVTAAFYASQVLILVYAALFTERGALKNFCYFLATVNFGLIVASGSRGSFLTLLGSGVLMLYFLRSAIGTIRTIRIFVIGIICLVLVAAYVVTQTEFNVLFDRLAGTEISEKGVPDTRQHGFDLTMDRLDEAPVFGHGPEIRIYDEFNRHIRGYKPLGFYPHNLALFLIYTIGITGLIAYSLFFVLLFSALFRARKNLYTEPAVRYMPLFGMIFMVMFFVDQLKIEFLRFNLNDYQHYVFFLLGMFSAFATVSMSKHTLDTSIEKYGTIK